MLCNENTLKPAPSSRKRNRRTASGLTLIELLIAITSLSFLSGILLVVILTAKTAWQSELVRVSNNQDLMTAALRIARELQGTDPDSIANNTGSTPPGFSFLSAVDDSGKVVTDITGAPLWQKEVLYCIPAGTRRLLRKEIPLATLYPLGIPTEIPRLTSLQMAALCDGRGDLITPAATSLGLRPGSSWSLLGQSLSTGELDLLTTTGARSFAVSIGVERISRHGAMDRRSREFTVFIRNKSVLDEE